MASGHRYIGNDGVVRLGTYVNPYNQYVETAISCFIQDRSWVKLYAAGRCLDFKISCNPNGGIDHSVACGCAYTISMVCMCAKDNCACICVLCATTGAWKSFRSSTCLSEAYVCLYSPLWSLGSSNFSLLYISNL